jgi:phospholipid/cholesterol/gamma-HCH transport system substrate-binding protein
MLSGRGGPGSVNLPQVADQADETLKALKATALKLQESAATVSSSAAEFKRMSQRMNEPDGTLDKIARSTDTLVQTGQNLNSNVAPRLNRTAEDAGRAARQFSRLADGLIENPQTLLTGKGAVPPGPGEPGFSAPVPRP